MRRRLFLWFFLVIVISISITGIISLKFTENNYLKMVEDRLIDNAIVVKDYILEHADDDSLDYIAKDYGIRHGMRMTIVSQDGTVIGDSDANVTDMDNHHDRPEIMAALNGEIGKTTRYSDTLQTEMMYIAIPMGNGRGVLRMAMPLTEIQTNIQTQWRNILITIILSFLIAAYQGNLFSVNITNPIHEMVLLSNKMAQGDFGQRIEIKTRDEMGQLADAFNTMASRLEYSVGELKDSNMKFGAILSSMTDGIIAVDLNYNIILINPMARKIFNINGEVMDKYFLEVIRNSQIDKALHQALYKDNVSTMEINMDGDFERILMINVAPIKEEEGDTMGALILAKDITELRKLEQIRTDFVANVSHELKTPLTSIKGFVETLQHGAVEDTNTAKRFLDIIDIETDRLARLINDILILSEIESKKDSISIEKVNLSDLILETLEIMKSYAKTKEISLGHLISHQSIWINGNKDRIKQMIINLVDNAIKYTPEGGSVTVLLEDLEGRLILRVRDTGIGISKEHIPRLFERFYRVDKGRSRNLGGTGLGLAIVKHIVISMKGDINVQSTLGKGTEFIITLPRK